MLSNILKRLIIAAGCMALPLTAMAVTKIYFWHSMAGGLGEATNKIVNEFNKSQSEYKVISVYKGTYNETLTALVAAFRARQQPDIAQVFEVGTATMINPPGIIVPVYKLMAMAKIKFDADDFIPAIREYYSDTKGRMLAMPFNSSSAIFYYNKAAFKKAGLNPDQPPTTWPQVEADAQKIVKAGYSCGFTTTYPSWIQIETFSAWHNLPLATKENGFGGLGARVIFNNKVVIHQIASLTKWQHNNTFQYGGRGDNALALFTSGQCAMLLESSGSLVDLKQEVSFPLGVGKLPYWPNVPGAPQNTIIGGAALWAISGHSEKVYKGIAQFFAFLAKPKIQAQWMQATGYVPVTHSAYKLSIKQGYYKKYPGAQIAVESLNNKPPKPYTRGLRLGNYSEIRDINVEEIEAALTGQQTAKQAINNAVLRDNRLLKQFEADIFLSRLSLPIHNCFYMDYPMTKGLCNIIETMGTS